MTYGVIFDLDGTLYRLKGPEGCSFAESDLGKAVRERSILFLQYRLDMTFVAAVDFLARADQYGGASRMVERVANIPRAAWFAEVWNLPPGQFVRKVTKHLDHELLPFAGRSLIVTSGPQVWAARVLEYLGVSHLYPMDKVMTGEGDLRKPDRRVFTGAAERLGRQVDRVVSVGDTFTSDIAPAQQLGMPTILVGKDPRARISVPTITEAARLIRSWS